MENQSVNTLSNGSKLKNLAADAKEAEGSAGFMEPEIPKKAGRHKKDCQCEKCKTRNKNTSVSGGPAQNPVDPQTSKKTVEPLFKLLSNLAVEKTGEKSVAMSPPQLDACSTLGGALVDKYLPDYANKWGLEIGFGITFGSWFLGVALIYKAKLDAQNQEKKVEVKKPLAPVQTENVNAGDDFPVSKI